MMQLLNGFSKVFRSCSCLAHLTTMRAWPWPCRGVGAYCAPTKFAPSRNCRDIISTKRPISPVSIPPVISDTLHNTKDYLFSVFPSAEQSCFCLQWHPLFSCTQIYPIQTVRTSEDIRTVCPRLFVSYFPSTERLPPLSSIATEYYSVFWSGCLPWANNTETEGDGSLQCTNHIESNLCD